MQHPGRVSRWAAGAPVSALALVLALGVSCSQPGRQNVAMPALPEGARLFRQHCAACHGEQGFGDGPAAIALRVRPRDFREESFRYVSTLNGVPQREDLVQTIRKGRRYGEMPAHPHLPGRDIDLLVDYVLQIHRLSWERRLQQEAEEGEELSPEDIREIAEEKITPEDPVVVTDPPPGFRPDTEVGARLYQASCAACHGPTGRGDGLERPRDERGQPIKVRDLTGGEFRGGTSPRELFKRIRCGVPGTPMASQALLSDEEVWQLVYYARFLAGK